MKKTLTLMLCTMLAISSGFAKKPQDIQLNLKAGHSYYMSEEVTLHMPSTIMGISSSIDMDVKANTSYTVVRVDENGYLLNVKIESLRMEIAAVYVTIVVSPEKQDLVSMICSKLIGMEFQMTMDKRGKITDINLESLFNSMQEGLSMPGVPEPLSAILKNDEMKKLFDTMIKSGIEQSTAIYPDHPVSPGDSWVVSLNAIPKSPYGLNIKYTYAGRRGGSLILKVESAFASEDVQKGNRLSAFDISGDIVIDRKTGWVKNSDIEFDVSVKPGYSKSNDPDSVHITGTTRILDK